MSHIPDLMLPLIFNTHFQLCPKNHEFCLSERKRKRESFACPKENETREFCLSERKRKRESFACPKKNENERVLPVRKKAKTRERKRKRLVAPTRVGSRGREWETPTGVCLPLHMKVPGGS